MQQLEHQIRERAYHLWVASGCGGQAEEHWLAAEREVLATQIRTVAAEAVPARRRRAAGGKRKAAPTAAVLEASA